MKMYKSTKWKNKEMRERRIKEMYKRMYSNYPIAKKQMCKKKFMMNGEIFEQSTQMPI